MCKKIKLFVYKHLLNLGFYICFIMLLFSKVNYFNNISETITVIIVKCVLLTNFYYNIMHFNHTVLNHCWEVLFPELRCDLL